MASASVGFQPAQCLISIARFFDAETAQVQRVAQR
jgi:hypothetical protein